MPRSAATRSAGRLHPRNRAPSLRRVFYVLLSVVALLSASAVIYGTPWAASASKPQCNNRIDDDGDGKIDYPTDPGCTGRGDKSEVDPVAPPPPPPPQQWPDESNTGVKDPSVLTQHPNSIYTISTPGAVVENKIFSRQVVIAADNVTIRNCLRKGASDSWGILVNAGVTGTLIEDVEIDGMNSSSIDAGIGGNGGWTARRVNIHGTNDGVKLDSNILIEDSYIHDLAVNNSGAHQDGMQSMGGSNVTIRHNRIKARVGANQNAGVWLATDFSPLDNYKTENNWISGGGYSYWTAVKSGRPITNFVLSGDHFTRNDYAYDVVSIQGQVSRSGNVWHDTLQPIPGG